MRILHYFGLYHSNIEIWFKFMDWHYIAIDIQKKTSPLPGHIIIKWE